MLRLKWIFFFALLGVLTYDGGFAVDRNNFKTCDQSGFCKRLRKITAGHSNFALYLDSAKIAGAKLTVELVDEKVLVPYVLELIALKNGTFRLLLNEKTPLKQRYKPVNALKGPPQEDGLMDFAVNREEKSITVSNKQGHKVVIEAIPLRVIFFDLDGNPATIVNNRGLLTVEHLRKKAEETAQADEHEQGEKPVEAAQKQPEEDGSWDEYFKSHHDTKPRGPEALSLDISFPEASHVYGIPEHADKFALRSTKNTEPYRLYNLDVFEYELDSTMALYGSIPVLYAHGMKRSVGVFWHNAAETWVDIDNSADSSDVVSSIVNFVSGGSSISESKQRVDALFMSESGVFDCFIMLGPEPADTYRQFTALTGTASLPQYFSLAYHQSRWNYNDQDDVRAVDAGFDTHDIPVDVLWLDIEYTDQKKYFTWDPLKFSQPEEMVKNLTTKGRKLVVIIDPHIKREAGYFIHDDATNNGYYVKNKDGKDYEGWCWPGSSGYLDFFDPKVSSYYSSQYAFDKFTGTTKDVHLWNDMNEPSVFNGPEITMPKDNIHYGGWDHRHVHNEYGLAYVKATHEGLLARSNGNYRPFILSRAFYPGTQRYAAIWTGDNIAEWSHLAVTIPMVLSIGVSGISFCGADVGGFFKNPDAELMTRWYQAGAFQPFFRAHSHIDTKRREPWLFDQQTTRLIRDAIRKRYSYLPLWYTLFYEHTQTGSPVVRPIFMHYPKEKETFDMQDQYMIGEHLLVHPVTEPGKTSVQVHFPGAAEGHVWYDIESYTRIDAGKITQEVNIAKIPVYQKGGSIVAKKERIRRASALMADDPYTFVVTLDANKTARGSVYIDDGETFDYKNGKFIYANIEYKDQKLSYSFPDPTSVGYSTRSFLERVVIAGLDEPPKSATLRIPSDLKRDATQNLHQTYHRGNKVLVLRKPAVSMAQEFAIQFK